MPRLTRSIPSYRKHRASGQAVVTLGGRDFYRDPYGTRVSRNEYDRLVGEWLQQGRQLGGQLADDRRDEQDLCVTHTGSPTVGSDPHHNQVGTVCESCHGPALEHVRFNVQFIHLPPLGPELEQAARNAIRKGKPANSCVQCHVLETHQQHPQFDEK